MRQPRPFLTHASIWRAIDAVARRKGLSTSALARKAGLDPTTFNQSKRMTSTGRERWPSTESIAKVLAASDVSFTEFAASATSRAARPAEAVCQAIPIRAVWNDDGLDLSIGGKAPGKRAPLFRASGLDGKDAFAIEVRNARLEPLCRRNQVLIVVPECAPRPGMLLAVQHDGAQAFVGMLEKADGLHWHMRCVPGGERLSVPSADVRWSARVLFVEH